VLLPSTWSAPPSNSDHRRGSSAQRGPTQALPSVNAAGAGVTQQKLAAHKLHTANDALVLTPRPIIAHLPAAAEETPQLIPPSPLHQRELHALILPTVSTAKGNIVRPTNNALTGSTALTGPGFPLGLLWLWTGQLLIQHFRDLERIHGPEGERGPSIEVLGDDTPAPLLPACQQLGKEHLDMDWINDR
jgi:hypothetical protein